MGLKQTLKRLASVRGGHRKATSDHDMDGETLVIDSIEQPVVEDEPTSFHGSEEPQRDVFDPDTERPRPIKPTGKRKPSNAAQLRQSRQKRREKDQEPSPTDYLYFGEGVRSPTRAASTTHKGDTRSSGANSNPAVPSIIVTGTDSSGFLNSGMTSNNQQMGYQNLTHGGSLQYDYAGVQAPNTGVP
ncbi:hypothetical protein JX265_007783 [Neoarthrinium moseri]|uniref:Uncharacterized protein n=1 Tax=Neoarthrinium moseri TaxID=1658444 RepID=A0A9Q0AN78_9PEZI|nr:hypothetical protein JX265_007783 [Neoarthrinium moseri]